MKVIDVVDKIEEQRPRVIYLSGKTCTGKSTFAKKIQEYGYSIIELDSVVMRSVVVQFGTKPGDGFLTAYRDIGPKEQTSAFIDAAKKEIQEKLKISAVVVEGAIATARILKEVFSGNLSDFVFVYFHPVNPEIYSGRIRERFIAGAATGTSGLPKHFWEILDQTDLQYFLSTGGLNEGIEKTIGVYTELSMTESLKRLNQFKAEFTNMQIVEI